MKPFRIALVSALTLSLSGPAFAGGLRDSIKAAASAAAEQVAPSPVAGNKMATIGGAAIFATGMAVGLNAFINNKNGKYSEFGEANAVNKKVGAAGISMAFAGGMIMFLGNHAKGAPALSIAKGRVSLGKALTW
jgi:hypothetical protein